MVSRFSSFKIISFGKIESPFYICSFHFLVICRLDMSYSSQANQQAYEIESPSRQSFSVYSTIPSSNCTTLYNRSPSQDQALLERAVHNGLNSSFIPWWSLLKKKERKMKNYPTVCTLVLFWGYDSATLPWVSTLKWKNSINLDFMKKVGPFQTSLFYKYFNMCLQL